MSQHCWTAIPTTKLIRHQKINYKKIMSSNSQRHSYQNTLRCASNLKSNMAPTSLRSFSEACQYPEWIPAISRESKALIKRKTCTHKTRIMGASGTLYLGLQTQAHKRHWKILPQKLSLLLKGRSSDRTSRLWPSLSLCFCGFPWGHSPPYFHIRFWKWNYRRGGYK